MRHRSENNEAKKFVCQFRFFFLFSLRVFVRQKICYTVRIRFLENIILIYAFRELYDHYVTSNRRYVIGAQLGCEYRSRKLSNDLPTLYVRFQYGSRTVFKRLGTPDNGLACPSENTGYNNNDAL